MKRPIGMMLLFAGALLMILGIVGAADELRRLYADTLNNPLDAPQEDGTSVSDVMLKYVAIGVGGAPMFIVGLVMFKLGRPHKHAR